jgi:hypothetical protein
VLFVSYIFCGLALPISPFFLLLLEEFELQLQHLTPHSILQVAIFVHFCEMFMGVAACTSLFRQFFVLVRSGKGKDHVGAYYFQTRSDPIVTYIASLGSVRWENWRHDWVIARTEVSDHLALPSDGPSLSRKQWREKPRLVPEFVPILDRIKELAVGGLSSMHVLDDFLKRRVMPLQGRPRLCCWFTDSSDIGRILRGPGTDLTWEELEIFVRGITGEAFIPESLMPPQGISPLCEDPGLRSAVLARLPTLDESGVAVRQTSGRDPIGGSIFLVHQPEAPSLLMWPPGSPLWAPAPRARARSLHVAPLPRTSLGGRGKRGDLDCVAPMGPLFRTHPLIRLPGGRGKKDDIDCVAPMGPLSRTHPLIRAPPRSARKRLVGLRRPNLRPRTGRGA